MAERESSWFPAMASVPSRDSHGYQGPLVLLSSCPGGEPRQRTCSMRQLFRNWAGNGEYQPQWEAWCIKQSHKLCGTATKGGLKIVKASLKSVLQDLATGLLTPLCQTTPVMQKATAFCFSTSHVTLQASHGDIDQVRSYLF